MATIMAHEEMKLYAYISIIEAVLKLVAVFTLQYITWDKLELYGLLVLGTSLINLATYCTVCVIRYEECQFRRVYWDPLLMKQISGFSGWTVFGALSTVFRTHGITVLLNQSFSPAVVAARALSVQISSQINIFSSSYFTSLYPPIIKAYAEGQRGGYVQTHHARS